MTGSRCARMARSVALVITLPVLVGAGPRPTATGVSAHGFDHGVDHGVTPHVTHGVANGLAPITGDTIVVAARDLPRGTVLRAADIEMVVTNDENVTSAPVSSTNPIPAAGWVVRRLVHKGEPLRAPAVAPPVLIPAGSPVSLVWEVGDLRVTRTGTAVGAAYAGETVTVRVDAKRRFTGIATAPGTVVVTAP